MTLISSFSEQHRRLQEFFNSNCPCIHELDDNVHYSLKEDFEKNKTHARTVDWPSLKKGMSLNELATLDLTYLNVARPPLSTTAAVESNTYVSLPFHITTTFEELKERDQRKALEGGMDIGANINPLAQDPFKLVHLNPGCISEVLDLCDLKSSASRSRNSESKKPLNRFAKMFRVNINNSTTDVKTGSYDLLLVDNKAYPHFVESILNYDPETYYKELNSPDAAKLLISCNVNVLNIFALDPDSDFTKTVDTVKDIQVTKTDNEEQEIMKIQKVIEVPLLRVKFFNNIIVTCMRSILSQEGQPLVFLGFNTGDTMLLNLETLHYIILDKVNNTGGSKYDETYGKDANITSSSAMVTSICVLNHHLHELLITVGYSNGEIAIFDPYMVETEENALKYIKSIVDKDEFITYFRKFDLSPFNLKKSGEEVAPGLIGHFKISHKSITSIASTLAHKSLRHIKAQVVPYIIMIASDDGFVKVLDLTFSSNLNYGDNSNPMRITLITDIFSNYFHCGITGLELSPDCKYLCVIGRGDLIEVFKLSYLSVNSYLNKSSVAGGTHHAGNGSGSSYIRRSRSNTVNSNTSEANNYLTFLSPISTSPIGTNENRSRADNHESADHGIYPPLLKDIRIVVRLKSHSNAVQKVKFVENVLPKNGLVQKSSRLAYNLVSCGFDGKLIIWEFDYRGLPKLKHSRHHVNKINRKNIKSATSAQFVSSQPSSPPQSISKQIFGQSPNNKQGIPMRSSQPMHSRSRSIGYEEPLSGLPSFTQGVGNTSITNVSSIFHSMNAKDLANECVPDAEVITSLYKSLFDLRVRKHYGKLFSQWQTSNRPVKYSAIIHPVIHDNRIPSIEVPVLVLDLSHWFKDGKIDGFNLDPSCFWCFGKSGDILKYKIH